MLPATTNIFCCVFNLLEGRQKLSCALVAGGVVTNLQEVEALFVTQKRVFNTHFTKSGATKRKYRVNHWEALRRKASLALMFLLEFQKYEDICPCIFCNILHSFTFLARQSKMTLHPKGSHHATDWSTFFVWMSLTWAQLQHKFLEAMACCCVVVCISAEPESKDLSCARDGLGVH